MPKNHSEIFAAIEGARRVWAVAPPHGEARRLQALHMEIMRRWRLGDRIVYLGNYLGLGPDIIGTIDELLLFRRELLCRPGMTAGDVIFLRGAQEEIWHKLLQIQFATQPGEVFDWMMAQGAEATLRAYGGDPGQACMRFREGTLATTKWAGRLRVAMHGHPGHDTFFASLKRAAYTEKGELLFVHAGIDPERPVSEQRDSFWWGSSAFEKMAAPYSGFRLVVRGYDRYHGGFQMTDHYATIDGGCGFGGALNAACLSLDGRLLELIEG